MKIIPTEFAMPRRILFGIGKINELLNESIIFGNRGMIVHGTSAERNGALTSIAKSKKSSVKIFFYKHEGGEPTLRQLDVIREFASKHKVDWICGVGGGSVIDIAKACAGLMNAPLHSEAYHDGAEIIPSNIPFIAVPTTAGTGSEATFVCVFTNERTNTKKSFRHPCFMANTVFLDASLLATCPHHVIAYAGMDAITQAIESFSSNRSTWLTDIFSTQAIDMLYHNLIPLFTGKGNEHSTEKVLLGSFFAGVALCNARLGLVHGLAHPLGAFYKQPHGLVCAICLPFVLEYNRSVLGDKYEQLAIILRHDPVRAIKKLLRKLHIKSPFTNRTIDDIIMERMIKETLESGSTAANPRKVGEKDVYQIILRIFR